MLNKMPSAIFRISTNKYLRGRPSKSGELNVHNAHAHIASPIDVKFPLCTKQSDTSEWGFFELYINGIIYYLSTSLVCANVRWPSNVTRKKI